MDGILDHLHELLLGISASIGTIGLILVGLVAIFAFKSGGGLRQIISGAGIVGLALIVIGGSSAFATALLGIGKGFGG